MRASSMFLALLGVGLGLGVVTAAAQEPPPSGGPADDPAGDATDDPVEIPGKIHKLLEMDQIPAIRDPRFVEAKDARIPDGHRVIGVVIDGDARAYCPNILNHHEIVNDEIGGRPVAVTW